ncbi:Thioredoxin-like fold protein [Metarhizium guizhouense ARSEF 977]|uniref:Thioredoxin-like fold protein n=1 Tax=Metarhizium guizhouense (strain ARSEF 977) TaxID=1276136 RepID=A0A0B4GX05_METGA|nr:Thioredoxin-like fold protein [Metarhizium guizhouense ARSEF 977]
MFSSLATKIALKKAGIPSNALDFSSPREPNKLRKDQPADDQDSNNWSSWLSYKSLPLTVHPWLSPPPPPIQVSRVPRIGEPAPRDRHGKLATGRGRRVLVVFLRCVGCACKSQESQLPPKTFINLRTLANRHSQTVTCVAVSHASEPATRKWIDLLGGAWNVQVVIDEDRAIYAAWGLGVANVWHLFNPTTQVQGWKEKGWLGDKVAEAMQRKGTTTAQPARNQQHRERRRAAGAAGAGGGGVGPGEDDDNDDDGGGISTVMGNKWQESGAFAVDGRGTVIWGGKAMRADDVMDLEEGAKLLAL